MRSTRGAGWIALAVAGVTANLIAPSPLQSQYGPLWRAQVEGHAGWLLPHGEVSQLTGGTGVQLSVAMMWGGRVLVPITREATGLLGRASLGLHGFVAPSAEMTSVASSTPVGTSDYYQVTGLLSTGHFMPHRPVNMTFTATLLAGVGYRTFAPDAGVTLVEADNASTALVLGAAWGVDMLVHSRISVVAEYGITLGIRDRNDRTVAERSHPLLLGMGVRF
jgi:hypothetical protein